MILYYKKFVVCVLLSVVIISCSSNDQEKIPYPVALKKSIIEVENLNDMLNGSLIIGNGDINALVYQNDNSIVLNLTKNDVWDARLETENDPPIPTLDLINKLGSTETAFPLKDNNSGYVLPEGMKWNKTDSYHSEAYPCPRQCARIMVHLGENPDSLISLLNLRRALVNISNSIGENVSIRALAGQNSYLIESNHKVELLPVLSKGISKAETGILKNVQWIKQVIPGDLDWEGMSFVIALASSPKMKAVSIITSFESENVVEDAVQLAISTIEAKKSDLVAEHESIWEKFWSESGIMINNEVLQSTWYRSLYFLRCFSKPGVQSVGLFAGLINDTPAWHGDYHTNYNIQQTFWTAFPSNHSDMAEPYDRLIYDYLDRGKWLSNKVFSFEGAYYPHVMYAYEPKNPEECKSKNGRQYIHHTWGMTIGVNGFSIQPLWWRYKYDPEINRLKNYVYPVLKEVATFYAEFIESCDGDDVVKLGPSVSPEHWGWTKNLIRNYNCTFDIAYAQYSLKAAIEAAEILEIDHNMIQRFKESLSLLPDYPISKEEYPVVLDVEGAPVIEYNIPVPTTPIFPADVVTWFSSPEEKDLFSRTIENIRWNGNNATFMLAIARARLSVPNSINWLEKVIIERSRPNGTISLNTLNPPKRFNDYGHYTEQFGAGMAVTENLLQSVNDIIRIFPSSENNLIASFKKLRTQGGFLVSANTNKMIVDMVKIESLYGGELKFVSPWKNILGKKNGNSNYVGISADSLNIITINTSVNDIWEFKSN